MAVLSIIRMEFFQKSANGYYIHTGFLRFLESLSCYFERIDVCAPVVPLGYFPFDGNKMEVSNVRIIELPNLHGFLKCQINAARALWIISKHVRHWDLINIRIPEPFSVFAYFAAVIHRKPVFIHIVADGSVLRNIRIRRRTNLMRMAGGAYNVFMSACEKYMISRCLSIVNGSALFVKYGRSAKKIHQITTSSYWESEIQTYHSRRYRRPYRILYVGRFSREKGLADLVYVLHMIRSRGYDARLRLVGYPGESGIMRDATKLISALDLTDSIEFAGHKLIGIQLWNEYRWSHIFVLPSHSEGTPRVILEAMSQGIPVVATDVGGVSDVLENGVNGITVKAGSRQEMADAIMSVLDDSSLRNALIRAGIVTARERTLTRSTKMFVDIVRRNFPECH